MPGPGVFDILSDAVGAPPRCDLEREYGSALVLQGDRVAVNFVATVDGVVSFGAERDDSRAVGGGVAADRLLMAMLRAVAGVIVVGAGTLRATLNHQWTPAAVAPEQADALATLRAASGRPATPAPLLVVAGGRALPAEADAVRAPAVPLHVVDGGRHGAAGMAAVLSRARELAGGGPVLCEGGPHLLGSLLEAEVAVELFITIAPQLAGHAAGRPERRNLVEGAVFAPFSRPARLLSVRRGGDHLLLRYLVDAAGAEPGQR